MQLAQIEALAEKLYNPQTAQERQAAEQSLSLPVATPEALSQCLFIVGNSNSSYALVCFFSHCFSQLPFREKVVKERKHYKLTHHDTSLSLSSNNSTLHCQR